MNTDFILPLGLALVLVIRAGFLVQLDILTVTSSFSGLLGAQLSYIFLLLGVLLGGVFTATCGVNRKEVIFISLLFQSSQTELLST